MFAEDLRFVAHMHGSPETIFDLVADMPNYGRWLPNSSACGGTVDVAPYPVRLGTTYLDAGPIEKPGSVTEYDRLKHISFHACAAGGTAMACEDCKEAKSVFHRSAIRRSAWISIPVAPRRWSLRLADASSIAVRPGIRLAPARKIWMEVEFRNAEIGLDGGRLIRRIMREAKRI